MRRGSRSSARRRTGGKPIEAAASLQPDVIVMDIRMPVMDGVEATRRPGRRRRRRAGPRILILTTFDADEHVVEALRAGASGFLLKDVPPADFVRGDPGHRRRARRSSRHRSRVGCSIASRGCRIPADESHAERLGDLTEREREVLKLVAQGLSNREIAERLVLAEPTVKTHVSHLLLKLDLRDRAQLVVLAYELGVVRPGSSEAE